MYRSLFKWLTFSTGILFLFTTCAEEIVLDFPFASLSRENGLVFKDTTLCEGQDFSVKLRINAGDSKMTQLAIYENTALIPTSRLSVSGPGIIGNPITLTEDAQNSAVYDIRITPSEKDTIPNAYTFRVIDEFDQPAAAGVTIDIGGPKVDFLEAPNRIFEDSKIFRGNLVQLRMELTDCWQDLEELQIYEDGVLLPSSQVDVKSVIDSTNIGTVNPILFTGENKRQFVYDITINPSLVTEDSTTVIYSFQLINDRNQITYDTLRILNIEPTELDQSNLRGRLFNQAFDVNGRVGGLGGLDLDEGLSVPADSSIAEIQDEGIQITFEDSLSWRQQISVVDTMNTQLKVANLLLGQTFESITFKEQIVDIFDRSVLLGVEENLPADQISDTQQGERVSPSIKFGDVFVIRKGTIYYLIKCENLNIELDNNGDSYDFTIKY